MADTTQLKCEICGEVMVAKIDTKNSRVFVFCPTMLNDHDIYIVEIATIQNKAK